MLTTFFKDVSNVCVRLPSLSRSPSGSCHDCQFVGLVAGRLSQAAAYFFTTSAFPTTSALHWRSTMSPVLTEPDLSLYIHLHLFPSCLLFIHSPSPCVSLVCSFEYLVGNGGPPIGPKQKGKIFRPLPTRYTLSSPPTPPLQTRTLFQPEHHSLKTRHKSTGPIL